MTNKFPLDSRLITKIKQPAETKSSSVERKSLIFKKVGQASVVECFAQEYESDAIYVAGFGWHLWDGSRYKADSDSEIHNMIYRLSANAFYDELYQRLTASFIKGVLEILSNDPRFRVQPTHCDVNNMILNTPNGVTDLETSECRPSDKKYQCTYSTTVAPKESGGDVFNPFLRQITSGDDSLMEFLQVLLGSILSGAVERHWIAFFIGNGANGKSTLMDAIKWLLGDYAIQAKSETLMSQMQYSRNANPDIVRFRGKRLVLASEISKGAYLDDEKVKSLTGDATITARNLYSSEIEFPRTHKHIVLGNSTPRTREIGDSMGRRIIIVPFTFTASHEDPDLPVKLKQDAHYILWWLIEGHKKWINNGKRNLVCNLVTTATQSYFDEQPTPEQWLREYCEYSHDAIGSVAEYVSVTEAHQHYTVIWQARGYSPLSFQPFLAALDHIPRRKSGRNRLMGVKLKIQNPHEALRLGV